MRTKYLHLAQTVKEDLPRLIARGIEKLPSEAALMRQYNVSRQTVRRALAALAAEGLVESRQGSGTYVCRIPGKAAREVAVLLPSGDDYLYPALLHDLREALAKHGYALTLRETGGSVYREREQLCALLRESPAGIIAEGCKTALPNPNTDL
ncbi:MAG: GntR family transcriptional regulator, partial [Eubacteriales bacterium]|nr:GntR family transcriptional regulator [Eubacteriales bacterium]